MSMVSLLTLVLATTLYVLEKECCHSTTAKEGDRDYRRLAKNRMHSYSIAKQDLLPHVQSFICLPVSSLLFLQQNGT